ncbi:HAMP domain-containing sensor histidine kinase [Cryomorphaceae bacterium 1068]|nr:HAMP domain-containing sensor histidine kinase [Cryomorphaceae bacterium 1068]
MRGNRLSAIIFLMTISIIGIIGLQTYWLQNAIEEKTQEFDKSAKRALYATIKDLARSQAETTFIARFGEMPDVEQIWEEAEIEVENVLIERDTVFYVDGVRVNSSERIENLSTPNGDNVYIIERHSSKGSGEEDIRVTNTQTIEIIEEAIQNVVVRGITQEPNLETRIGEKDMQEILAKNLELEGVQLDFSYAVIKDTLVAAYSNVDQVDSTYFSASLFPDFPGYSALYLGFPSKGLFVLQAMGGMLLFVLVFSILMVTSFIYAVRYMLQQKRLSAMKSDFINNMTHEFKTPLATIGLAAESIIHPKMKGDDTSLQRYSELILHESKRLNYHVENILQMAKIERKELMLKKEQVSISELVLDAIDTHRLMIEKRSAKVEKSFCQEDDKVFGDVHHLCNAISNLIDNALKYSFDTPHVAVDVTVEKGFVCLIVADQGIGMNAEAKEKAFDAFYRAESGDVHTVKGFGVGLSYVKEIVDRHNGEVILKSKLGQGTTVTIKIPQNES